MAKLTTSNAKRAAWKRWADHCFDGPYADPPFMGRSTIGGVPTVWVDAVVALDRALTSTGYVAKSVWAYNFRVITGSSNPCNCSDQSGCSLHGYGIAIDIDPKLNPYLKGASFSWSATAFTPAQVAAAEAIRNTKGEQLWFWGGRWSSIKDYMHWEAYVDPASTTVDWSTVPGETPTEGNDMLLKKGSEGQAVAELQKIMAERFSQNNGNWPPFAGKSQFDGQAFKTGQDGGFGPTCEANVMNVQGLLGQAKTGVVDDLFWSALVHHRYGAGGLSAAQVDAKIAAHAKTKASGTVHPHGHDEGTTGPPQ